MNANSNYSKRRYQSYLSGQSTNALNLKKPWLAAAWSFTFPGFGHFYTNNFLSGMLLMVWEHYYTFTILILIYFFANFLYCRSGFRRIRLRLPINY